MRKWFAALVVAVMMLFGAVSAYAVTSPVSTPNKDQPVNPSPKTTDFNIVAVETAGVAFLGIAGIAAVRVRKDA